MANKNLKYKRYLQQKTIKHLPFKIKSGTSEIIYSKPSVSQMRTVKNK